MVGEAMRHKAFREGLRRAARRRRLEALAELAEEINDGEELEELEEVARRHAEWDGKSPHPYGCDGREGPQGPVHPELEGFCGVSSAFNPRPDDSVDIQQETTAEKETLSAVEPGEEDGKTKEDEKTK